MRIGLLTNGALTADKLKVLKPLVDDNSISIDLAVIYNKKDPLLKKLRRNIRKGRGAYIFIMAIKKLFSKKERAVNTKLFCKENNITVIESSNPYSKQTLSQMNSFELDALILLGGFGILKGPLLSISKKGVLSYHHGDMRLYRGTPPAFWELFNDEEEMGVTVQILGTGLDCGIPVEEKAVFIGRNDNLKTLRQRIYQESEDLMYKAVKKISNPLYAPTHLSSYGKVYTLPTLSQWMIFQMKMFRRQFRR